MNHIVLLLKLIKISTTPVLLAFKEQTIFDGSKVRNCSFMERKLRNKIKILIINLRLENKFLKEAEYAKDESNIYNDKNYSFYCHILS